MLKYVEIDNSNLEYATYIQMPIFPKECAFEHYKKVIKANLEYRKYFLVYDKNKVGGITGLYSNENLNETNSIWLGGFGVLKDYQNKGYGKQNQKDFNYIVANQKLGFKIVDKWKRGIL